MEQNLTQKAVKSIFLGLIIYIGFDFLDKITSIFDSPVPFSMNGEVDVAGMVMPIIFSLASIVGLIMYMMGLKDFATQLDEVGSKAIKLVFYGVVLTIIANFIGLIPLMGFLSGLVALAAFILEFIGLMQFRRSTSLNEIGSKGAGQLYLAMIFALIGSVVGIIPLIGAVPSFVLMVLYYIFLFMGWSKVKSSFE